MQISTNNYHKTLDAKEIDRYKRHISLQEIGILGQQKLKNSSVIFIGAGGLGSPAILYIAAAGIGKIGIADNDQVEESNLQRQIIHDTDEIGKNKTDSAEKRIKLLNPNCIVNTFTNRITPDNVLSIIQNYDIVCDCSDNFGSRYLINDACILLNKTLIFGSVQGFEGQVSVFNLKQNSPNLRDLLPNSPEKNNIPSCSEFGVIGVSTGLIGILQANEIIKIIIEKGEILDGKILIFNLLTIEMKKFNLKANAKNKKLKNLLQFKNDYENTTCDLLENKLETITNDDFRKIYKNVTQVFLIDVREKIEFNKFSLEGSISIPLSSLSDNDSFEFIRRNAKGKTIYIICQRGVRSEKAAKILATKDISSISVEGGLDNLSSIF